MTAPKRSPARPAELTVAESAEKPVRIAPPIPDHVPSSRPWVGGVGETMAAKDAQLRSAELLVAQAEGLLRQRRLLRAEEDAWLERASRLLGPRKEKG